MITMMINIINELSDNENSKVGRPSLYSNEDYIKAIFRRLRTGLQWSELDS